MKQSRDRKQHRLLSHIYYFVCGRRLFTEVITSLQMHAFRQRYSPFAASVNQRCILRLLRYSRWIPSVVSSLPITPRFHPNLNIWNQSWVRSLSCSPRIPCSHISRGLAKSGFLWAMLSCKQLLWPLVAGASHCSLCIKRKQNFFSLHTVSLKLD